MAEIIYCDGCGKRIREGEGKFAVDAKSLCATCHAKASPGASTTTTNPIPADITTREALPKSSSQHKAMTRETPAGNRRSTKVPHDTPAKGAPLPAQSNRTMLAVSIGAGVLILCGVLAFALSGGKGERSTAAAPKRPEPPKPANTEAHLTSTGETTPRPPAKPVEAAKTDEKEPSMDEIREGYAQRTLTDLIAKDKAKSITLANYRKALTSLIASHGSTKAGQEAKAVLAELPQQEPETVAAKTTEPPAGKTTDTAAGRTERAETPGTSKELFHWKGEANAANPWREGEKDEKEVSAGKSWSARSTPITSGWLSTKMAVNFGNLTLPKDGWLRIHVKSEGVNTLMFHSGVGEMVLEMFHYKFKPGAWTWVSFRLADCKKNVRSKEAPPAWDNEKYSGTTVFGHAEGTPANVWIDEVIVGTGPMPE